MESVVAVFLTPILTGLIVWSIERYRTKKEELKEQAEEINAKVNVATMELAYATSIAVENHKTNGELKNARQAYAEAKKELDEFNQKQLNKIV